MELSYWERDTFFDHIDVVVIGAGIVGLNAALSLKKKHKKLKITVLERGILPTGASSRNAGFACFGSASELIDDLKTHTEEEVLALVEKRWKGLQRLRKNLGDKAIDFHNWGGFEVFDSDERYVECAAQLGYLNKQLGHVIGSKNVFRPANDHIPAFGLGGVRHMIESTAEGQIDTGMMISALAAKVQQEGVHIIYGFEVSEIKEEGEKVSILGANGFNFEAKRAIIAVNGFARKFLPEYEVFPGRAQVLITQPIKKLKLKGTFHYDSGYYYFRNVGKRVLLGGGRNLDFKTEETTEFGLTSLVQDKLDQMLAKMILPYTTKYEVDMRWSGIMGLGPQKKSIVQAVSPNVFCAVRMGGMGVAIGSLVGEEVANLTGRSL